MAQRNRELSQFGSFLEIDNENKNIGITTTSTPFVGIGTTNPTSKLDVVGHVNVSGVLTATTFSGNISSGLGTIVTFNSTNAYVDYLSGIGLSFTSFYASNIGIGTTNTTHPFQVGSGSTIVVIDSDGDLGVGTDNPTSKLDVVGHVNVSGVLTATTITGEIDSELGTITDLISTNGYIENISGVGLSYASSYISNNIGIGTTNTTHPFQVGSGSTIVVIDSDGDLGVGTDNPQYKLDVLGNTNISGVVSATGFYLNGTPLVDAQILTWSANGPDVYVEDANVGIGISTPDEKLTVIGNVSAEQFISTATSGTPPLFVTSNTLVTNLNADLLRDKIPPGGSLVGDSDNQTLTNKTINLSENSLSGNLSEFNSALSDDNFTSLTGTETLTNKTLVSPVISSISNSGIQIVPSGNGFLVSTNSVGLVTTGMIADGTITNADIASNAGILTSKLSAFTISGIPLGSTLNNLTAGDYVRFNGFQGGTYDGSTLVTVSIAGTIANTANTLVARNASGDFTAGTITANVFNATLSDAFRVNGTTVINSSRNLINVANASLSGVITASSGVRDSSGNVRAIPQNSQSETYTLTISDVGKHVNISAGVGVTVPANIFSTGDAISVFNNTETSKTVTVGAGVTLRLAGTALTGTRYLSQYALATVLCISNNVFTIVGAGVT